MSILLHIETALENASVCLSADEKIIAYAESKDQQQHAAWLHAALADLLKESATATTSLKAVSVSIGPGSYTGLRVGLSTAKGLCYALNIPLITVGTLELIAFAAIEEAVDLICPAIDARRMEVFSAIYTKDLQEIKAPAAMILDAQSFGDVLSGHQVLFCGNGKEKIRQVITHAHAKFSDSSMSAIQLAQLALQQYRAKKYSDLAYTEPLYIKNFYTPVRRNSP